MKWIIFLKFILSIKIENKNNKKTPIINLDSSGKNIIKNYHNLNKKNILIKGKDVKIYKIIIKCNPDKNSKE